MPSTLNAVAVFCGSRFGKNPLYKQAAQSVGQTLAGAGIRLVYGGGAHGLMGVVADATLAAGGTVTGVIPDFLESREKMHEGVAELIVTESMHSRKQIMFSRADAFWILPGGFGTFDEMMEILTWKQLGRHSKPIVLINVAGWANTLLAALDDAVEQGFASASARAMLQAVPDIETALSCSLKAEETGRVAVEQL
ncbi:TIGR00730 family Rossman fold protein [Acetobacter farinalis]|uniref:Cytokinin riboside 5'-monophosphate phosphoribohydrolase n=1 Tax=Acetobacter farinalis TaxID=1260984 RepID=A0ABT3Q5N1_9PROT|nr:TIGR00730 family Rossman fold protein [Acetobacter farinalis]MCX2560582.1 TIGR00730 family Rossman fold protein [Acetobacter farinalis]NHO29277.1 TIGR00730 family Rossman fold protein [Acetobacter farinalis]